MTCPRQKGYNNNKKDKAIISETANRKKNLYHKQFIL